MSSPRVDGDESRESESGRGRFDVFLSHNSVDKPVVQRLAEQLRARRLSPWLDVWMLVPGTDWQDGLAAGLRASSSCAVFLGAADVGAWQRPEVSVALDRAMHDATFRVFLVLLPGMPDPFDPTAVDPFLSVRTWVDVRDGVDDLASVDRFVRAVQGLPIEGVRGRDVAVDESPYRGLLPFREADSAWFFGRDSDVQRLVEKLKTSQFLAVVGPSGSGKSSVTLAALLPVLRLGAVPGSESWTIVTFTPGARPLEALTAALLEVSPELSAPAVLEELCLSHTALSLRVRAAVGRVVLVVDQAEEAFTLCTDAVARERFFGNLLHASTPGGPCTVIVTMRADFYPHAAAYPAFAQALSTHQYLVGPLGRDELRQVIEQPALAVGLTMQPGLVDVMLDDVEREPGALPLLEHALLELWESRQADTLTLAAYAETGGVAGAVSTRADQIWASFTPIEQTAAKQVLLRLTQPGEGAADTKRPAALAEIATASVAADDVERVVRTLADARLVTTSGESDTIVEVAHESLIRAWPRLRGWIDESRDDLRIRQRVSRAAADWEHDRSDESLWHGTRLATALEWAATNAGELNQVETDFLAASRRDEDDDTRRRHRRLATVMATLSALTITSVVLLVVAVAAGRRASDQEHKATEQARTATALALAAQAGNLQTTNTALGLALAAESTEQTDTALPEATRALFKARTAFANRAWQPVGEPLTGHTDNVMAVAFNADGTLLASASFDDTVRLWDPATGDPVGEPLTGHTDTVYGVAFNPDGTLLASASFDGTVRLWDPATGNPVGEPLTGHAGLVFGVAFNPDGTLLASAGADQTVRLWDPATGNPVGKPLTGHTNAVVGVASNPGGTLLASASFDGTVRLWDPATGDPVGEPLAGHNGPVYGVAFNPDGTLLASAGDDGAVRLWDPATGDPVGKPLTGHTNVVNGVAFNADGNLLASASWDQTVRLWDPATGDPVGEPLTGHAGLVFGVAFNGDGTLLASASFDDTVRLWDPSAGDPVGEPLTGHIEAVFWVAFNADGTLLASASRDQTVRLWDPATGDPVGEPLTGTGNAVTLNPDGTLLASAADDWTVRLWDPAAGNPVGKPLTGHNSHVRALAFNPDGTLLASASRDQTVRLWDPATGNAVGEPLSGHADIVMAVAFNHDGTLLASASFDDTVRLWDPATGNPVGEPLTGHTRDVNAVAFNPDGTLLASASLDQTVRLWDPATGDQVGEPLTGHTGNVNAVAFNRDGTLLASASFDGTVRLWDPATGNPVGEPLTGHTGNVNAVAFNADGTLLASANDDHKVWLWDDVWNVAAACKLASRYVVAEQVQAYLLQGQTPKACRLD